MSSMSTMDVPNNQGPPFSITLNIFVHTPSNEKPSHSSLEPVQSSNQPLTQQGSDKTTLTINVGSIVGKYLDEASSQAKTHVSRAEKDIKAAISSTFESVSTPKPRKSSKRNDGAASKHSSVPGHCTKAKPRSQTARQAEHQTGTETKDHTRAEIGSQTGHQARSQQLTKRRRLETQRACNASDTSLVAKHNAQSGHRPRQAAKAGKHDKPHKCGSRRCKEAFAGKEERLAHMKRSHNSPRHPCQVPGCNRDFSTKNGMHVHMRTIHDPRRHPYLAAGCNQDMDEVGTDDDESVPSNPIPTSLPVMSVEDGESLSLPLASGAFALDRDFTPEPWWDDVDALTEGADDLVEGADDLLGDADDLLKKRMLSSKARLDTLLEGLKEVRGGDKAVAQLQ